MLENIRAAIINLGCKANKYESDAMADKLKKAGAILVDVQECADVYIVNTCSVTNMAEKKSRQMLRRAKKLNPDALIVAAGCYVNADKEAVENMEFVDIVVGNNMKKNIVEVLEHYFTNQDPADNYIDINCTHEYEEMGICEADCLDHQRAYIKIQDGCNQFCSYCLIPYTRGRVRSRREENILNEIRSLAGEGVKEFVLTGIHISSYGVDLEDYDGDLGDLIESILAIPEVLRLRLGSLEPRIITRAFLDKVSKSDKLCPHFHLSLQSACNDTLQRMNRKYTIEEFEEKCKLLREYFDTPAITTDVIVGFPGETEAEFETTRSNLLRLNLYEIHVFKYSLRSGTVAARLPGQVMESVKSERSEVLLSLTARQKDAYEKSYVDKLEKVLVEEPISREEAQCLLKGMEEGTSYETGTQYYTGHTRNYIKVAIPSDRDLLNQIVEVRLQI